MLTTDEIQFLEQSKIEQATKEKRDAEITKWQIKYAISDMALSELRLIEQFYK